MKEPDLEIVSLELKRLSFIENRDGTPAKLQFAKQVMEAYGVTLRKVPSILTRRSLIISRMVFRKTLIEAGEYHLSAKTS